MTDLSESMHRLIEPWTLVVTADGDYRAQDFPPLVDMLRRLVVPSTNSRGGGGAPDTRNVIDAKALDLQIHIEDVVKAWLHEWGVQVAGELKLDLRGFHDRLDTLWRTGGITEDDYQRLALYPDRWAAQIWDLIEPPLQVALRGATCPICGRGKWVNDAEEWVDNILVSYRDGGEVQAECRWRSCVGFWSGTRELRELAFHVGADIDFDVLREMGEVIDTP